MPFPGEIQDLCAAFRDGLEAALGAKLYGVYLYGAAAFADGSPIGDVDFHVLLHAAPDDAEKAALRRMHAALAEAYPPLGAELDGYYILLEDARRTSPPNDRLAAGRVDASWALHCAHIHRGRCIVLSGPDPGLVYPEPGWPALAAALDGELAYVERNLAHAPAYCVLNLCRLMYSFETRDVVASKFASARWARAAYPGWGSLVEAAQRFYLHSATPEDAGLIDSALPGFLDFAREAIAESRRRWK